MSDCIETTESLAILCLTPYSSDIFAIVCKFRDCISNWKNSGCVSIVCISFHVFRNFLFVKVSKLDHSYLLLLISLSLLSSFLRIFQKLPLWIFLNDKSQHEIWLTHSIYCVIAFVFIFVFVFAFVWFTHNVYWPA